MFSKITAWLLTWKRLGWSNALRYLWGTSRSGGVFQVKPPQLHQAVSLRAGTTDSAVFSSLFLFREITEDWKVAGGVVIDLGANIGLTTAYFAQSSPDLQVIAVEPDPDNFHMLVLNTNHFSNLVCLEAGVWPEETEVQLFDSGLGQWARETRLDCGAGGRPVKTVTMPKLLERCRRPVIDLLKIDIEGAESALFSRGWEKWLPQVRRIVIELHDTRTPDCSRNFYRAISSRPFAQSISGEKVVIHFLD